MYSDELKRVRKKLKNMIRKGKLKDREVYLFGVSDNTRQILQLLREYDVIPCGILDNDPAKIGSYCSGIKVSAADQVEAVQDGTKIFLMHSYFWREMTAQLLKLSVPQKSIVPLSRKKAPLWKQLLGAYRGKRVYGRIVKQYGKVPVFLCPYTGTGDIYLIGVFWKQYLKQIQVDDYIFIVINKACQKVTDLFDIKHVKLLKAWESSSLIKYYMLHPEGIPLKILNDSWGQIRANPLQWFRGYNGLYFTELFRRYVFDLPEDAMPEPPVFRDVGQELSRIFEKNGLVTGKTVILSPYANTLADLPEDFWSFIAKRLKEKGFVVCTNSGSEKEKAIAGTIKLFFPLNFAPQLIEKAGYFVGIRSGFCDVISAAKAKKIVLYDRSNRFFNSSAYEYFSLNHMGLCEDAVEIEFDNQNAYQCVPDIMKEFE